MGQNNILNKYVNINKIWVQKDEWGSDGTQIALSSFRISDSTVATTPGSLGHVCNSTPGELWGGQSLIGFL